MFNRGGRGSGDSARSSASSQVQWRLKLSAGVSSDQDVSKVISSTEPRGPVNSDFVSKHFEVLQHRFASGDPNFKSEFIKFLCAENGTRFPMESCGAVLLSNYCWARALCIS